MRRVEKGKRRVVGKSESEEVVVRRRRRRRGGVHNAVVLISVKEGVSLETVMLILQ